MNALFVAVLLFASLQGSPARREIATGDWSNIPLIENRTFTDIISSEAVAEIHKMVGKDECRIPGQSRRHLNLTVPFLIHYAPGGNIDRVVIRRLGCSGVERLLGSVLIKLAQKGQYRATGKNEAGWYRGEFSLPLHNLPK